MKHDRPSRISTRRLLAGLAALAIILSALASCTMVGDRLNGVKLDADGPTSCVKDCNDSYKVQYAEEQKAHQENVDGCQALSQPDKDSCLSSESARHSAAMEALGEAKIECQNNCHRQGSGSAS